MMTITRNSASAVSSRVRACLGAIYAALAIAVAAPSTAQTLTPGTPRLDPRAIEPPALKLAPPASGPIERFGAAVAACTVTLRPTGNWLTPGCRIGLIEGAAPNVVMHPEQRWRLSAGSAAYSFQLRSRPCDAPVALAATRSCDAVASGSGFSASSGASSLDGKPTTRRDFTLP